MTVVDLLFSAAEAYLVAGVCFSLAFVTLGASRIDATADRATGGFRMVIFPGAVALWPWLLYRWVLVHRKGRRAC